MALENPDKCPFYMQRAAKDPTQLNLKVLHPTTHMNDADYRQDCKSLDIAAVKADLVKVLTTSQDWWPADYGHYGPLMIRLAWHSAGTYRIHDGRGGGNNGNIRFSPLNSWPDNGNLDKAKRLLWPIKKKYGKNLSWADLILYAGTVAMEDMGFKTFGFALGREDIWEPEADIYWGPEEVMLTDERHHASGLEKPLGADQMGLIYVNPEGPGGNPDPLKAAERMKDTFGRMAMNDEETVALVAGGHTFGKAHGAGDPNQVGPAPEQATIELQNMGWKSSFNSGKGGDTITSGLEGAWTQNPVQWNHEYFQNLFKYDWEMTKSPAGATQWVPKDKSCPQVPGAHDKTKTYLPVMFTTDLALKMDPAYAKISKNFFDNPSAFEDAFARAWYKLTHRDMGPHSRCLGNLVAPPQLWQDPVPPCDHAVISGADVEALKGKIMETGCSIASLVRCAWGSASTYRVSDHRGGANGARIRLAPQKDWEVNGPAELAGVLGKLEAVQKASAKKVSLADVIVLAGCAAVEAAAKKAGQTIKVPVSLGRMDTSQEQTDVNSFAVLEPTTDGFRNYLGTTHQLVDRAHKLNLTAPEMTALVGGMRALNANAGSSQHGVFTKQPETLSTDFFVNLLDMNTTWKVSANDANVYEGRDYGTGELKWTATQVDLVFGSNSELRAIAEVYACDDAKGKFAQDFANAWGKVMNLDRWDIKK